MKKDTEKKYKKRSMSAGEQIIIFLVGVGIVSGISFIIMSGSRHTAQEKDTEALEERVVIIETSIKKFGGQIAKMAINSAVMTKTIEGGFKSLNDKFDDQAEDVKAVKKFINICDREQ